MQAKEKINVAPSSTEGHFVRGATQVVNIDEINETFHVRGSAVLETKNHTTLKMEEDCLVTCQTVYDPFEKISIKSRD